MDFLDPKHQRRYSIQLIIGYVLITIAVTMITLILIGIAVYGFGFGKNGQVVQKGLLFVSSAPAGANITISGSKDTATTNARLSLTSGPYQMTLNRNGYRAWRQAFTLTGASVLRLDYPFLFPQTLQQTALKPAYSGPSGLATQSPDRRWLLVQLPGSNNFDVYDLKNPKTAATQLTLPTDLTTAGTAQSWSLEEWSDDNQHVVLNHVVDGKTEYILLDRADASKSVNLNKTLGTDPSKLTLLNKKYDQYYVYDAKTQALQTAKLSDATLLKPYLSDVLAYQSYGNDIMLYVSSKTATDGKVAIDLLQGGKTYLIREVAANTTYLLNLTQYDGSWYVAAGASSESKVYIYKNPLDQLSSQLATLVPVAILKTANPNYLAFSSSAQYIMDENGSQFSVYDVFHDKSYQYDTTLALDAPQPHANWMDAARINYVTGGKLVVFDFDNANRQTLMNASPSYTPFYSPDYKFVDTLVQSTTSAQMSLTTTSLRTAQDQ